MTNAHTERQAAMAVESVTYRYGERRALDDLSFTVREGEIYGLLGPNGGGKTTLFRLLSSLTSLQTGRVAVFGDELGRGSIPVRRTLGVGFQTPSLDVHLTVRENMAHQGHLYGLRGARLAERIDWLLDRFGLSDRAGDRVSELSGGLQRRIDIAKALIHEPRLLLLDEPSTGLDPGIRRELWSLLEELRTGEGVTVLLTTHYMEEGDRCDRVGLLHRGRLVGEGTPAELKAQVGGDVVRISTSRPEQVRNELAVKLGIEARISPGVVWFEREGAHQAVVDVVEALSGRIRAISVAQPTLEDVFLQRTGHGLGEEEV
jgi:ABC-2 type transport system ATP-binding protein